MAEYLLLLIPKKPILTKAQFQTVVDICVGVGLIGFGSVAVPVFLNRGSLFALVVGIAISFTFWYLAIRVSKNI